MGRLCGALAVSFVLSAAAAEAQVGRPALVASVAAGPARTVPARPDLPDFGMRRGEIRAPPDPVRNGLIGTVPFGRNLQIAVGRFAVPNFTAPRMEAADIRRRDRGIAAVGFSFRF